MLRLRLMPCLPRSSPPPFTTLYMETCLTNNSHQTGHGGTQREQGCLEEEGLEVQGHPWIYSEFEASLLRETQFKAKQNKTAGLVGPHL